MVKRTLPNSKKENSPDWFLTGILTKFGDTFDRLTGRGWKPSSSLATSELIERMKLLLDAEVRVGADSLSTVPHNIMLKMQWDKFSTDSESSVKKLRNELHIAAIDHINDKKYFTIAPVCISIKPDYFTEGVKLLASFEGFNDGDSEAAVNVTLPDISVKNLIPETAVVVTPSKEKFILSYTLQGQKKAVQMAFSVSERKSVGRTKENDISIDDVSISKIHASFVFNSKSKLLIADTGSTNGTFINGKRIAYGRSFEVNDGDSIKFGAVAGFIKADSKDDELLGEFENVRQLEEVGANDESEINQTGLENPAQVAEEANFGVSEIFGSDSFDGEFSNSVDFSDLKDSQPNEDDSSR